MATFVCPNNKEVDCSRRKCGSCGWNPEVAAERLAKIMGGETTQMPNEKLFRIPFTGYCEVWAESPEKAVEKADNDDMFFASYEFGEAVCLEEDADE